MHLHRSFFNASGLRTAEKRASAVSKAHQPASSQGGTEEDPGESQPPNDGYWSMTSPHNMTPGTDARPQSRSLHTNWNTTLRIGNGHHTSYEEESEAGVRGKDEDLKNEEKKRGSVQSKL